MQDCARRGGRAHVFATLKELRNYTINTGRIYPKEKAYKNALLRYLSYVRYWIRTTGTMNIEEEGCEKARERTKGVKRTSCS